MTVAEKINELTNQIIKNQQLECEWNDKMHAVENAEEFEQIVLNRSKVIRELYQDNMNIIHQFEEYMENLNDETANALYETARAIHLNGRVDPALICKIADPVIRYFKDRNIEEEKTIILSSICFADAQDYYNRMIPEHCLEENLEHAKWVVSHKDKYLEYNDLRVRRNIFHMYSGMISAFLNSGNPKYYKSMFDVLKEARELATNEEILQLEGEDPAFLALIENFDFWLPWEISMFLTEQEYLEPMLQICDEFRKEKLSEDQWNEKYLSDLILVRKKLYLKEISVEEASQEIVNLLSSLPEPDWENNLAVSQYVLQSYSLAYISMMHMMKDSDLPFAFREDYIKKLNMQIDGLLSGIPYQYNNSYVSALCLGLFTESLSNVRNTELIDDLISNLMLRRQPSTLFHSLMVGEVSTLIAEKIIEKEPELFVSLPEFSSKDEVLEQREGLLAIIRTAAKLHDLGKCAMAPVIMQQSRKIYDEEFECIKVHPIRGEGYLKYLDGYKMYRDVNLGHHKTYDGKGGYPDFFDNTSSEYRFLIDLISVSDSIDAATDITGRNYTAGKDFKTVLLELEAGAGSRYNPDIVRIISESQDLIEKLISLTGKERITRLYEVSRGDASPRLS